MPDPLRHRQTILDARAHRVRARRLVVTSRELVVAFRRSIDRVRLGAGKPLRGGRRSLTSSAVFPSAAAPRVPLAVAGVIVGWHAGHRELQVGARTLTVADCVSVTGVTVGAHVLVAGHEAGDGRLGIITRLIVR